MSNIAVDGIGTLRDFQTVKLDLKKKYPERKITNDHVIDMALKVLVRTENLDTKLTGGEKK